MDGLTLLFIGLSPAMAKLSWIWGPITGFFTAPIVGALSDASTSKVLASMLELSCHLLLNLILPTYPAIVWTSSTIHAWRSCCFFICYCFIHLCIQIGSFFGVAHGISWVCFLYSHSLDHSLTLN